MGKVGNKIRKKVEDTQMRTVGSNFKIGSRIKKARLNEKAATHLSIDDGDRRQHRVDHHIDRHNVGHILGVARQELEHAETHGHVDGASGRDHIGPTRNGFAPGAADDGWTQDDQWHVAAVLDWIMKIKRRRKRKMVGGSNQDEIKNITSKSKPTSMKAVNQIHHSPVKPM